MRQKRLDVTKLCSDEARIKLRTEIAGKLQSPEQQRPDNNVESKWSHIKDAICQASNDTLGYVTSKHQDWFDDHDPEAQTVLDAMHHAHLAWINDKNNSDKRSAYTRVKQDAQIKLREMKNRWWTEIAAELQAAIDRHDVKAFYQGLKAVYGPREAVSTPIRALDGTLLRDRNKILE